MSVTCRYLAAGATLALLAATGPAKDPTLADLAKLRHDKARQVYEGLLGVLDAPQGMKVPVDGRYFERLYQWSRRWLEAEQDMAGKDAERVAALEKHVIRMKKASQLAEALFEAGTIARVDRDAVEFYRLEAASWLRKAAKKE
jgi:hypothetical protein